MLKDDIQEIINPLPGKAKGTAKVGGTIYVKIGNKTVKCKAGQEILSPKVTVFKNQNNEYVAFPETSRRKINKRVTDFFKTRNAKLVGILNHPFVSLAFLDGKIYQGANINQKVIANINSAFFSQLIKTGTKDTDFIGTWQDYFNDRYKIYHYKNKTLFEYNYEYPVNIFTNSELSGDLLAFWIIQESPSLTTIYWQKNDTIIGTTTETET